MSESAWLGNDSSPAGEVPAAHGGAAGSAPGLTTPPCPPARPRTPSPVGESRLPTLPAAYAELDRVVAANHDLRVANAALQEALDDAETDAELGRQLATRVQELEPGQR